MSGAHTSDASEASMREVTLSAVIHQEDDLFVAECPELGTVSQGRSIPEALVNLREATELFLEAQPTTLPETRAILTTFSIATPDAKAA
jgi:predicted RNase H-like HicB family nuclease